MSDADIPVMKARLISSIFAAVALTPRLIVS
jgi:hypothetical protein